MKNTDAACNHDTLLSVCRKVRQPLLSFRKKSRKQKVSLLFFVFIFVYILVQWTPHYLCFIGILRCCSFLSIEKNKELNKSLSQANRKAKKMEQQLQKSKVNSFGCYFPSTEKKMIVTASLQKLYMGVVRPQLLFSLMI